MAGVGGGGIPDHRVQCCRLVCRNVGAALPETREHRPASGHSPRVDVSGVCQHIPRVVSTSLSLRVDVSGVCQHSLRVVSTSLSPSLYCSPANTRARTNMHRHMNTHTHARARARIHTRTRERMHA